MACAIPICMQNDNSTVSIAAILDTYLHTDSGVEVVLCDNADMTVTVRFTAAGMDQVVSNT
jgi:hypothetical protein